MSIYVLRKKLFWEGPSNGKGIFIINRGVFERDASELWLWLFLLLN